MILLHGAKNKKKACQLKPRASVHTLRGRVGGGGVRGVGRSCTIWNEYGSRKKMGGKNSTNWIFGVNTERIKNECKWCGWIKSKLAWRGFWDVENRRSCANRGETDSCLRSWERTTYLGGLRRWRGTGSTPELGNKKYFVVCCLNLWRKQ